MLCIDGYEPSLTGGFIEGDTVFLYEADKSISPENAVNWQIAEILVQGKNTLMVGLKKGVTYAFGFTRAGVSNKAYFYRDPMFISSCSQGYVSYNLSSGEISVNPRASNKDILLSAYLSIRNEE